MWLLCCVKISSLIAASQAQVGSFLTFIYSVLHNKDLLKNILTSIQLHISCNYAAGVDCLAKRCLLLNYLKASSNSGCASRCHWERLYAKSDRVHKMCCLTTSEIKSVYSFSKQPHSKVGRKASCHGVRGDVVSFKYGDNGTHFQAVCPGRHSSCCTRLFKWEAIEMVV